MTPDVKVRDKIFISYSHQDHRWLERLRVHLDTLEKKHPVEVWDDTRIEAGADWSAEIAEALETTGVAILLISADFMASDFITSVELPALLSAAHANGTVILSIFVGPSSVERLKLVLKFQAVNDPENPLLKMENEGEREAVFADAAERCSLLLKPAPRQLPVASPEIFMERDRSSCREYGDLFEIHIKRQRNARVVDYALAVPTALVGLWLIIAACLLGDFDQQSIIEIAKLLIGALAVAFSSVVIKRGLDKSATIAAYRFMKRQFDRCESWTAAELRENIKFANDSLRKMLQT